MTMSERQYAQFRRVFVPGDDSFEINLTVYAVLWHDTVGVRVLLFDGEYLDWTKWCRTRQEAIDAALERAAWLKGSNGYGPPAPVRSGSG